MFVFEIIRPYRLLRFNGDGNTYYFNDNAVRIFVGRNFQRNGSSSGDCTDNLTDYRFWYPHGTDSDGSGNGRTTQGHKKSLSPPEKGERERCGASDKGNGITAPCGPSCSVPPELSTGFRLSAPVGSPPELSFSAARLSFWELQPPLPQGFPFRFRQPF